MDLGDEDVVTPEHRSETSHIPVVPIQNIVLNFFAAEGFLTRLFLAREKVLTQAREGKRSFFMFQYPRLGWYQYDHNSIEGIFKLAQMKSGKQLADIHLNEKLPAKTRLHAIAALLIQRQDYVTKLYYGARRARNSNYKPTNVTVVFQHPFPDIFPTNRNSLMLNGKELIQYQNAGHRLKFKPFIPFKEKVVLNSDVEYEMALASHRYTSADVDPDAPDISTTIGM